MCPCANMCIYVLMRMYVLSRTKYRYWSYSLPLPIPSIIKTRTEKLRAQMQLPFSEVSFYKPVCLSPAPAPALRAPVDAPSRRRRAEPPAGPWTAAPGPAAGAGLLTGDRGPFPSRSGSSLSAEPPPEPKMSRAVSSQTLSCSEQDRGAGGKAPPAPRSGPLRCSRVGDKGTDQACSFA